MSVVHEAICDSCGKLEGQTHQTPELAVEAAEEKGWKENEATGELLCKKCQQPQSKKGKGGRKR